MNGAWRPRTTHELLSQGELAPIAGAMVRICELPEADAARCHDELTDRAAELYDQVVGDAFRAAFAAGVTSGSYWTPTESPRDYVARSPLAVALAMRAEGWTAMGTVDQEPTLTFGPEPVTFDQAELDAIAAELRRTESDPS